MALDEAFLPPALATAAVPFYAQLLQEVVTGLDRIAEAHGRMVLGGAGRSVENLLVLELANAARPRLAHMLAQDAFHPAELFLELAGLAGRMATYGSGSRRLTELPAYDHLAPGAGLRGADRHAALADPQPALRRAEVARAAGDEARHQHLEGAHRQPRGARAAAASWCASAPSSPTTRCARSSSTRSTVGSAGEFDALWKSRLPGIALKPLHSQPREIPYDGDRLCLELDQKSEHWTSLRDAPGFVIGVSGVLPSEPQLDCYAVHR